MFRARYYSVLAHTEGDWRPLKGIHLALDGGACPLPGPRRAAKDKGASDLSADAASLAAGTDAWHGGPRMGDSSLRGPARAPRPQLLFQYKPYAQQDSLDVGAPAVAAVVEAVFGAGLAGSAARAFETLPSESLWDSADGAAAFGVSAGASTGEVSAIILLKLVMDNYLKAGGRGAYAPTLLLLQRALSSGRPAAQARVFDLLYNLSLHGELLYLSPAAEVPETAAAIRQSVSEADGEGGDLDWRRTVTRAFRSTLAASATPTGPAAAREAPFTGPHARQRRSGHAGAGVEGLERNSSGKLEADWPVCPGPKPTQAGRAGWAGGDARTDTFHHWLRLLLFRLLTRLASLEGAPDAVWTSALCTLAHLTTHRGRTVRAYVEDLPLCALGALLDHARDGAWAPAIRDWLLTLACNLLYVRGEGGRGAGSRSLKSPSATESLRSSTNLRRSAAAAGSETWWANAHLDVDRLQEFGGMRQLLRCYREAPTSRARSNVFCVMYDYITSSQGPNEYDSWSPALAQGAHSSEVVALGAALLHLRAADALHPMFLAGTPGYVPGVADELTTQMAAVQAKNPGRVIAVPPAFVSEVLDCLEDIACNAIRVPRSLEESVKYSLEVVAGPDVDTAGRGDEALVWDTLVDCLRDQSELGAHIGRGWLLKLLLASAEQELQRCPANALPALLPEVGPHGCQLAPGQRGIASQDRLRDLLERALATTGDSRAADAFMDAVQGMLAHIRLKSLRRSWEADPVAAPAPAVPDTASSTSGLVSAMRRAGLSEGESEVESVSEMSSALSRSASPLPRLGQGPGSYDSMPSSLSSQVDGGMPSTEPAESWQASVGRGVAVNAPAVLLSTLCLAVEWLLQAPQEARQGAMLQATQLLLSFIVVTPGAGEEARGDASPSSRPRRRSTAGWALGPLGEEAAGEGSVGEAGAGEDGHGDGGAGEGGDHTGRAPIPAPEASQGSVSGEAGAARRGTPTASGSSPSWSGGGGAWPSRPGSQAPRPPGSADPEPSAALRTLRLLGAGRVREAAALLGPGARAKLGGARVAAAGAAAAAALAAADTSSVLEAFLAGRGVVPAAHVRRLPPLLLRALFDDLRPDAAPHGAAPGFPAAASLAPSPHGPAHGAAELRAARRASRVADAALGAKAAVQAERPLNDARAAVLLLLMGRCIAVPEDMAAVGGPAFFAGLLQEGDPRIRRSASIFVLRHLMATRRGEYQRALRQVLARAQQANEESMVTDPYQQMKAILDMQLVDLST
ncbi:hypothetical protein ACKKBF_B04265 [Auxenochlorella protothecoides x Auxenochlorella symbiontica]